MIFIFFLPDGWAGDLLFVFSRPSEFDLPFFIAPIGSVSEKAAETGLKVLSNAAKIEAKVAAKTVSRIEAGSLKEFKSLVQQLSKPGSQLTKAELKQFEKLAHQFGGKL